MFGLFSMLMIHTIITLLFFPKLAWLHFPTLEFLFRDVLSLMTSNKSSVKFNKAEYLLFNPYGLM